jgi:hypothetical protein|tara:strand:+ start:319 stop:510 length:192 start_codon:yes stop_codon:yes gene_type:complete
MGMSNYILGNVDKFWDIAEETASKSTTFAEFSNAMDKHADLLQGSGESTYFEEGLSEIWANKG